MRKINDLQLMVAAVMAVSWIAGMAYVLGGWFFGG